MKVLIKVPEIHRKGFIIMDEHDKKIMLLELAKWFTEESMEAIRQFPDNAIHTLWDVLRGRKF
tara:strand:+ start:1594 stop:1782 length:189 start_codon:yes stop_codon:yes gene_type:complete